MKLVLPSLVLFSALLSAVNVNASQPNIVIVIADDQGYGDLGHTGNPVIKTPNIDALASESTSLTDYHVAPTCSPTRSALMTGHWTDRTGVWHTINGRSMLRANEVTLGQLLKDNGYTTGMFGKWHLGDNFPYRPEDRGFDEVYRHGGGGVGQTPDVWDNAYFGGSYFHNGEIVPAEGFCTDVFFGQARKFIKKQVEAGKPFFAYISTNAPHGPLHCPQKYLDMYPSQSQKIAAFYGMITNIDDNVGATRKFLKELGVSDNTLFIFTTDNGTATGNEVFNAGMRGKKGSEYEGGHRVPFIAHWPAAGWNTMHRCDILCHAVDVVPTVVGLAGGKKPQSLRWDGVSIETLLDPKQDADIGDRMLVTDSQRIRDPIKWRKTAVMSQQWRLINGAELFEIKKDPSQEKDVAADHPQQVKKMKDFYDGWWAELEPTFLETTEIYLGAQEAPRVTLTCHDWIGGTPPWNQHMVRAAMGYRPKNSGKKKQTGGDSSEEASGSFWAVKVLKSGKYNFELRRWPTEANKPLASSLPAGVAVPGASKAFRETPGEAIPVVSAGLRINGDVKAVLSVAEGKPSGVQMSLSLQPGSYELAPFFKTKDGKEVGAYYCIVTGPTQP
ncbi:MAG: arylsulfatase [Pirellulales bacterium]|nr:arylsulfatase [Pirellulales bacterium]